MARGADGRSWTSIEFYLAGAHYPCGRAEILRWANKNNAEEGVVDLLRSLPEREYRSVEDVSAGLQEVTHAFRKDGEKRPAHLSSEERRSGGEADVGTQPPLHPGEESRNRGATAGERELKGAHAHGGSGKKRDDKHVENKERRKADEC